MTEQPALRLSRKLGKDRYEALCEIYFIEAVGLELIKIGYALRVLERFRSMLTASPCRLSLLGTIPGGPQREALIHAQIAAHVSHGEWFHKSPEVMALVATATPSGAQFLNQVAKRRGEALQAYLAKMKAGEVVRPTRGKERRPRSLNPRSEPYEASTPPRKATG